MKDGLQRRAARARWAGHHARKTAGRIVLIGTGWALGWFLDPSEGRRRREAAAGAARQWLERTGMAIPAPPGPDQPAGPATSPSGDPIRRVA